MMRDEDVQREIDRMMKNRKYHVSNTGSPIDFPKSMNDRFKKLTDQAGFVRYSAKEDPNTPIDWSSDYSKELQKFYELIIEDCIDILEKRYMGDLNREDMEVLRCIEDIKKHFQDKFWTDFSEMKND